MVTNEPEGLRVAVNTQTPLFRFREDLVAKATSEQPLRLDRLREPDDFKFTTGGVTRMLLPLLSRWLGDGTLSNAEWVALAAGEQAPDVEHSGIRLSFVGMSDDERKAYAQVKERMWALLNSDPTTPAPRGEQGIADESWRAFDLYQDRSARALQTAAERMGGADLLYVHDFQQVGVARAWQGPRVPRIFHLHTPFPSTLPDAWADFLIAHLEAYDAIIVSTQRYAHNLRNVGLRAPIHVVPPFIDPAAQRAPTPDEVAAFRERALLRDGERVILNVGRMDPVKAQDRLIKAMPRVLGRVGDARLVLVGNGSFSNSKKGGLGLSKGAQWRTALEALAHDLHVADRVTFTGHVDDELIPAAYAACDVFCLPSTREGFGLAVIEAWQHGKPVVVSERAGVSELVEHGSAGRALDCGDVARLADALIDLLVDDKAAEQAGSAGMAASREATLPQGAARLRAIFDHVLASPAEVAHARS